MKLTPKLKAQSVAILFQVFMGQMRDLEALRLALQALLDAIDLELQTTQK